MLPRSLISPITTAVAVGFLPGCETYRVEYHTRPAFYEKAAMTELPNEVVLDDGTVVRYSTKTAHSSLGRKGAEARKPFLIREQLEDGSIVLRAVLPEHVIVNTLECLRNEEYEVLYDQLLAERTKRAYAQRAGARLQAAENAGNVWEPAQDEQLTNADTPGRDECIAFWRKHRHDLVATLTRMAAGMVNQEVSVTALGEGVTRCRLRPQIAEEFKFTTLDLVKEDAGPGLKLLLMR